MYPHFLGWFNCTRWSSSKRWISNPRHSSRLSRHLDDRRRRYFSRSTFSQHRSLGIQSIRHALFGLSHRQHLRKLFDYYDYEWRNRKWLRRKCESCEVGSSESFILACYSTTSTCDRRSHLGISEELVSGMVDGFSNGWSLVECFVGFLLSRRSNHSTCALQLSPCRIAEIY